MQQRMDVITKTFHAYSSVFSNDPAAERLDEGGKVLLPQSFLQEVSRARVVYPLQLLVQTRYRKAIYCGVLTFVAPEGQIIMPHWMLKHLQIEEGTIVQLQTCNLRKPVLIKLRPHMKLFTELSNPRAVLEATLRNHTCLTRGSTFVVKHAGSEFAIDVTEIKGPGGEDEKGVLVVDSDVKVDFERPLDMPPTPPRSPVMSPFSPSSAVVQNGFGSGGGIAASNSSVLASASVVGGGGLTFGSGGGYRPPTESASQQDAAAAAAAPPRMPTLEPKFTAFKGVARNLKGEVIENSNPSLVSSSSHATPATPPPSLSVNPTVAGAGAGRTLGSSSSSGGAPLNPVLLALQRRMAANQAAATAGGGGGGAGPSASASASAASSQPAAAAPLIGIGGATEAPAEAPSDSNVATGFIPFGGKGRSLKD